MARSSENWKIVTGFSLAAGACVEIGSSHLVDVEGLGILSGTFIAACLAYLSIETLKETKLREEKNGVLLSFENSVVELLQEFDIFLNESKSYRRMSHRRDVMREKWTKIEKASKEFVRKVYVESIKAGEVSSKNKVAMKYMDYKASQEAEVRGWAVKLDEECLALCDSMTNRISVCIKKYNYMVFRFEHYRSFLNDDEGLEKYNEMGDKLHEKVGLAEDIVAAIFDDNKNEMNLAIHELTKVGDVGDLIGPMSVERKGYEEDSKQYLKVKIRLIALMAFVVGFYVCSIFVVR